MKVKYKIVPSVLYGDELFYTLYRKNGFFIGWEKRSNWITLEGAKKGIEEDYNSYLRTLKKEDEKEQIRLKHLNQKVIYKDMP